MHGFNQEICRTILFMRSYEMGLDLWSSGGELRACVQTRGARPCHEAVAIKNGPFGSGALLINVIMVFLPAHDSSLCLQTNAINKRARKSLSPPFSIAC